MGYNMACYACQLGNQDEARHWLELAYKRGDKSESRMDHPRSTDGQRSDYNRGTAKGRELRGGLPRSQRASTRASWATGAGAFRFELTLKS
jgi:hypothetical protein